MFISKRVASLTESVTLKLNTMANQLAMDGKEIFNLTAGQLPESPPDDFIENIRDSISDIKSFQYSPVAGFPELGKKIMDYIATTRNISFDGEYGCLIGNGGKHVLTNILACLIDENEEVILMKPYWISYPQMIRMFSGKPVEVNPEKEGGFIPSVADIERKITDKTRAIVVNSPSNPAGICYSDEWMKSFGELMKKHPELMIISDEIYFELAYREKTPKYFYQFYPELLKRTAIVHGISKSLASTGLRIGWCVAQKELIKNMAKLQGQTSSGSNSLIQKALSRYDFFQMKNFLAPMMEQLKTNSEILKKALAEASLERAWYETDSAFYFMLDFSKLPVMERFCTNKKDNVDYSFEICEQLIEKTGVVIVPGTDFGLKNFARISMVLKPDRFALAIEKLINFIK